MPVESDPQENLRKKLQETELQLLVATDRAIGLEAEVERLRTNAPETEYRVQFESLQKSLEYRVGKVVTAPFRLLARLGRKVFKISGRKSVGFDSHSQRN